MNLAKTSEKKKKASIIIKDQESLKETSMHLLIKGSHLR